MTTSGKGAGAREGHWTLRVVESSDIAADRLRLDGLRKINVQQNARTERHLLRPYDLLVTARAQSVKVALVPPEVTRTVAASTLLVVRTYAPESGVPHYLWYYLTSKPGRTSVEARLATGATIPSLAASALAEIEVPLPSPRDLHLLASLVEASEEAYVATLAAAELQREALRDSIIAKIAAGSAGTGRG